MKRIKILAMIVMMLLLTGCVKASYNMQIKSNKNVVIDIFISAKEEFKLRNEEIIKQNDYSIKEYNHDGLFGYHLTKTIPNIDTVSSEKDETVVYDLLSFNSNDDLAANMFKVKKGFLRNTYTANFSIPEIDKIKNELIINYFPEEYRDYEVSFKVDMPKINLSNNANKADNFGKTLIWELHSYSNKNIEFQFKVNNFAYYVVFGGVGIVLAAVVIELFASFYKHASGKISFKFKKKNKPQKTDRFIKDNIPKQTKNEIQFEAQRFINAEDIKDEEDKMGMFK